MGRGGGRSGGGHSSRSHSHHSSSSRSSGRSYHSSGSYGRSHHSYGGSHYYGGSSGGSVGVGNSIAKTFLIVFVVAMLLPVCVPAFFIIMAMGGNDFISNIGIERSTISREMLPAGDCDPIDEWYRDDWGTWIETDSEGRDLESGLKYFYEKTGVQPYVWITGEEVGAKYQSEGSLEDWADDRYTELFGDDEGHLLLVFREYPDESGDYICTVCPGYDAEAIVMDDQAKEILLDYIDYYYAQSSLNEGQFFSKSFEKAADRIMTRQMSTRAMITIVIVVIIAVIALIVALKIRKKKKIAIEKQKSLQALEAAKKAEAEADAAKTEFAQQVYNDELEKQYIGVVCPHCGASGIKIRIGTVGYCQFCGSAIKAAGEEGSVATAVNPEEEAQAAASQNAQEQKLESADNPVDAYTPTFKNPDDNSDW